MRIASMLILLASLLSIGISNAFADDERDAFLKAIRAKPNDTLPQLVFADWLEERGNDADIRLAYAIRRHPVTALILAGPQNKKLSRRGFLEAIGDEPNDNERRLAYADWLENTGRAPDKHLAEFIRSSIEVYEKQFHTHPELMTHAEAADNSAYERQQAAWERYAPRFARRTQRAQTQANHPIPWTMPMYQTRRGLAEGLYYYGNPMTFVENHEEIARIFPEFTEFRTNGLNADNVAEVAASPGLRRIRRVEIRGGRASNHDALLRSPQLEKVKSLDLEVVAYDSPSNPYSGENLRDILSQPKFAELDTLTLGIQNWSHPERALPNKLPLRNLTLINTTPEVALAILESPSAHGLVSVTLFYSDFTDPKHAARLRDAISNMKGIRNLDLRIDITPAGTRDVLSARSISGLRQLHLSPGNQPAQGFVDAVRESRANLGDLQALQFGQPRQTTDSGVQLENFPTGEVNALLDSPGFPRLVELDIRGEVQNPLDEATLRTMRLSSRLAALNYGSSIYHSGQLFIDCPLLIARLNEATKKVNAARAQ